MRSVKRIKQSPSQKALSSPTKRQAISNLVEARNTIKHKFKKAYEERIARERGFSETFKPITSAITSLKSSSSSGKKQKNEDVEVKKEKKSSQKKRFAASTPYARKHLSYDSYDEGTIADDENGRKKARKGNGSDQRSRTLIGSELLTDDETYNQFHSIPSTSRQAYQTLKHSPEAFTYEVEDDEDDIEDYGIKQPSDELNVQVTRTDKKTGLMTPATMKWRDLPSNVKRDRIKDRERIGDFVRNPTVEKSLKKESSVRKKKQLEEQISTFRNKPPILRKPMPSDDDDEKKKKNETLRRSSRRKGKGLGGGGSMKATNKLVDFDFIPYNVKNNVIYEYFDDPNELCDRLRLLVSSRMAGNTNHMQEINSIIEELHELGYIK